MKLPLTARAFVALIVVAGAGVLGYAIFRANSFHGAEFALFLVVACVAARMKVKLPGVTGSMSVNLPFILLALVEMSVAEALALACLSNLTQCLPRQGEKFHWIQAVFNFNAMALAVGATTWIYGCSRLAGLSSPSRLMIATAAFFLLNTALVATVMSLAEEKDALHTWTGIFELTFPYFLLSAAIAAVAIMLAENPPWQAPLEILPLMFIVCESYRRYFTLQFQVSTTAVRSLPPAMKGSLESPQ
jgi:hypothetical protein